MGQGVGDRVLMGLCGGWFHSMNAAQELGLEARRTGLIVKIRRQEWSTHARMHACSYANLNFLLP